MMKNEKSEAEKQFNGIHGIFPIPVYSAKRKSNSKKLEEAQLENIIKEGMHRNTGNSSSNNSDIFNGKLQELKEFCEQHLKIYVEQIINPKEELDFYITQSWLNITKPGEYHHLHAHQNSLISGVFYISTVEEDKIVFNDLNARIKYQIIIKPKAYNIWNSQDWAIPITNNELLLFPSWLNHQVIPNPKATIGDRISVSFNTFARGVLGDRERLNELVLK